MAPPGQGERNLDPGIKLVLRELRDLRVEMRADRRHAGEERRRADARASEERRRADKERRRAEAERRQADEAWRQERRQAEAQWQQEKRQAEAQWQREWQQSEERWRKAIALSDERFQQAMREFREDSARREAATQKAFKDIRTVGLSIVKTLNHHTRLLERIDRKLGALGPWRPSSGDGRGA